MARFPLKDKIVLITGGTEGIGAACAHSFSERGARVMVFGLPPRGTGADKNGRIIYGDITVRNAREHLIRRALREFGRLDVLVNSAGVGLYATASETPVDCARRLFEVNFFSAFSMIQLVLPLFREQGSGAIVNIGSIAGRVALPWSAAYCATKHALHALSDSLYRELRREGIHVLTVIPGIVATGFRENVLAGTPPPRVGKIPFVIAAQELAEAIADGLERGRRVVSKPWLCEPFEAVNRWFPNVMDVYCEHKSRA